MTPDDKQFALGQLQARLQDNVGQRLTSAMINGLLGEMDFALASRMAEVPAAPADAGFPPLMPEGSAA